MSPIESDLQPVPPVPKQYFGLLGNLPDIDPSFFPKSVWRMQELYGDIFELQLQKKTVVISSYALHKEVGDDERFEKLVDGATEELRAFLKDGLFTAYSDEKNWYKAHRILMPVFGPLSVRKMFSQQLDIAAQMILKWDRLGPNNQIVCSDDFTRLAFDTIGLCAFNYRFNNFYTDHMHPFADQMAETLLEAGKRARRARLETQLRYHSEKAMFSNINAMHKLCDDLVEERINNPQPELNDLLNTMLSIADPETGEKLSKENIRYQMATFLVAGHETTSGTLSFLFYHLMKNPETYHKAQKEVDEILGDEAMTPEYIPKLKYIDAAIKETLRFQGPISINLRHARKNEVIGVKYHIGPETNILLNTQGLHHDPAVWGDDHNEFRPERMLDMSKVPPGAFSPFGFGIRSCIGRTFAEQEMVINVALILQRFQVEMADPRYQLQLKSTLTIKPVDFKIIVRRRPGKSDMVGLQSASSISKKAEKHEKPAPGMKLAIFYGSNAGTCKAYADDLAVNAEQYGYDAEVGTLDSAVESLPTEYPTVVITPSYEGKPADNAKKFVSWLEANATDEHFKNVKYALFGVGNSDWTSTFHKVPKLVDEQFDKKGARRVHETGFVDVKTDTIGPWEEWCEGFWSSLGKQKSETDSAGLEVKIERPSMATAGGAPEPLSATILENVQIADKKVGPVKMHAEIELPEDVFYQTGDYLVVYPYNNRNTVRRIISRFKLHPDDQIQITNTKKDFLQTKTHISIYDLLATRVELSTVISQRQLRKLAEMTTNEAEKKYLEEMASDKKYPEEILRKRYSVIDVLEDFPSTPFEFSEYLDMLKALSPRQYSISSSRLASHPDDKALIASITYDVHESPALSGHDRSFYGVASTHLADFKKGQQLSCVVRPTNAAFHLPTSEQTPIIMIAAGTGIAPMRGFIQERAALAEARGTNFGPALLYFGCRDIDSDYIYKEELEKWEKMGVVSLRPCFSKNGPQGCHKYTSDRLWEERDEVADLFVKGAKIFICGSASKIAKSTAETCKKIWLQKHPGKSDEEANEWLEQQKENRYVSDVFD